MSFSSQKPGMYSPFLTLFDVACPLLCLTDNVQHPRKLTELTSEDEALNEFDVALSTSQEK